MKTLQFHPDLLHVETLGDETVVKLVAERLDESNARPIGQQLADMVEFGRHKLLLDLDGVRFLSSEGLGTLIALHNKVRAVGGELRVRNAAPVVYELFVVTRLTELLNVLPKDAEQATPLANA